MAKSSRSLDRILREMQELSRRMDEDLSDHRARMSRIYWQTARKMYRSGLMVFLMLVLVVVLLATMIVLDLTGDDLTWWSAVNIGLIAYYCGFMIPRTWKRLAEHRASIAEHLAEIPRDPLGRVLLEDDDE